MNKNTYKNSLLFLGLMTTATLYASDKPNIVLIYGDDVGYGDISCNGAKLVKTPNIDRIAKNGIRFTDGHCSASTCTPSRYAMLTGRAAFRNKARILPGDAPLLIDTNIITLPKVLRKAGYKTGVVGKWHLGLGNGNLNWNEEIKPGPREIGFDYSFLIPATGDRVPCVYVENQRVVNLDQNDPITVSYKKKVGDWPTGRENPELLKMTLSKGHDMTIVNGISRIGYMTGGTKALWVDEDMADEITNKAVSFIDKNKKQPFFLYFSFHDIHVPRVPHPRFVGSTKMGPRGDAIAQMDWCVGQVYKKLAAEGLLENTIIIYSSDNGPVLDDGYNDDAVEKLGKHKPAGQFRGGKYGLYEGGNRMPFIISWPKKIAKGEVSNALVSQLDFLASFAALTGVEIEKEQLNKLDSKNILTAFLGEDKVGRRYLLEEGYGIALRDGMWKLITKKRKNYTVLYNLGDDIGEKNNLAEKYPEKVKELKRKLAEIKANPRAQ
ncbi:arylsulfatase [Lentisphaerota bacterium WC36G]|nr:arylsulfatase [Lentisphaerae bacterium WC36]